MTTTMSAAPVHAALACALLAACGGGGGTTGGAPDPYEQRLEAVALLGTRIGGFSNTGFTGQPGEMPNSGSATFTGHAVAMFDDAPSAELADTLGRSPEPRLLLVGDATLEADFAARTITGEARNFFGQQAGAFGDYEGTIVFRDGTIGVDPSVPGSVPNDIRFRYGGSLVGQGNDAVLAGDAEGKFKATPIRGLVASDVADNDLNGVATPSFFGVVAEVD
jgi:hypothetical protein